MLQAFSDHIQNLGLFSKSDKLLLAVSGGVDSTVLAHLLSMHGFSMSLAHCNFGLRGSDSDADERFCHDLAARLGVPFHAQHFNVEAYCSLHGVSVQMAARALRYSWFNGLLSEQGYHYLLTAHHADDQAETLFNNLGRGTGIKGLKGMADKKGSLVRPLLPFSKSEIMAFAATHQLNYRSDKSNHDTKYRRNFIRQHILPAFREVYPQFNISIKNSMRHFRQEAAIVSQFLEKKREALCKTEGTDLLIEKEALLKEEFRESILHHVLQPLGFNKSHEEQIFQCMLQEAATGKIFFSKMARVENAREHLVISRLPEPADPIIIRSIKELKALPFFSVQEVKGLERPGKHELYVDPARFDFPLTIRPGKKGDRFQPFGMKGSKLLSDFFKDEKLNLAQKERCRLLVNGNHDIIWVIGLRSDERYRLTGSEHDPLKITFIE